VDFSLPGEYQRDPAELGLGMGLQEWIHSTRQATANAYVERFNDTVHYEWLSQYYLSSIEEVQDFATQCMWSYNHDRPNMVLGGFTPKEHLAMAAYPFYFCGLWKLGGITAVCDHWTNEMILRNNDGVHALESQNSYLLVYEWNTY
jgi:hypothetical protein